VDTLLVPAGKEMKKLLWYHKRGKTGMGPILPTKQRQRGI
jgi:hypothetical protein